MFKFYSVTDIPFIGDAMPIYKAEAVADKGRDFGTAVKLAKGGLNKDYPFGFAMVDATGTEVDGIIIRGVNYGADGKTIQGMTAEVMTEGIICVKVESDLAAKEFGDKVYMTSAGKFTAASSGNILVGTIASNIFKAQPFEGGDLVDAAYINFKSVKTA